MPKPAAPTKNSLFLSNLLLSPQYKELHDQVGVRAGDVVGGIVAVDGDLTAPQERARSTIQNSLSALQEDFVTATQKKLSQQKNQMYNLKAENNFDDQLRAVTQIQNRHEAEAQTYLTQQGDIDNNSSVALAMYNKIESNPGLMQDEAAHQKRRGQRFQRLSR